MFGVDAHKRSHTVVAVDDLGRQVGCITVGTTTAAHLGLWKWAQEVAGDADGRWAVEDCRHLSRRLERDLLAVGEQLVRVPPKMMWSKRSCNTTRAPWPGLRWPAAPQPGT
jgi:transposase